MFLQLREGKAPVDDGDLRPESVASWRTHRTCPRDMQPSTTQSVKPNPSLYKTKLCNKYKPHLGCPYGPRCVFAHGEHELRSRR